MNISEILLNFVDFAWTLSLPRFGRQFDHSRLSWDNSGVKFFCALLAGFLRLSAECCWKFSFYFVGTDGPVNVVHLVDYGRCLWRDIFIMVKGLTLRGRKMNLLIVRYCRFFKFCLFEIILYDGIKIQKNIEENYSDWILVFNLCHSSSFRSHNSKYSQPIWFYGAIWLFSIISFQVFFFFL